jgi:hypothetical protein
MYICRLDRSLPTQCALIYVDLTNSMEQSLSWKTDSHSASQEIIHLLWNTKVHYHVHKIPPLVPIVSQMNAVHTSPLCFPKVR